MYYIVSQQRKLSIALLIPPIFQQIFLYTLIYFLSWENRRQLPQQRVPKSLYNIWEVAVAANKNWRKTGKQHLLPPLCFLLFSLFLSSSSSSARDSSSSTNLSCNMIAQKYVFNVCYSIELEIQNIPVNPNLVSL